MGNTTSQPATCTWLLNYWAIALGCDVPIVEAVLHNPIYQSRSMAQIWHWMLGQPFSEDALSNLLLQCGWQVEPYHTVLIKARNGVEKITMDAPNPNKREITIVYRESHLWGYKLHCTLENQQMRWQATGWSAISGFPEAKMFHVLEQSSQNYPLAVDWFWTLAERIHGLAPR